MTYRVVLTAQALDQVDLDCEWYLEHAANYAVIWRERFRKLLDALEENPLLFSLAHENDKFEEELREAYLGAGRRKTHRVLFAVEDHVVNVLAVRHFSQRNITPNDLE